MNYGKQLHGDSRTIPRSIAAAALVSPDAPAIGAPARQPLSYSALVTCVAETAGQLAAFGIERTDRVALVLPAGAETAVAFVAVASHAICAPLNPSYTAKELSFYLSDLGAKALIVASDSLAASGTQYSAQAAKRAATALSIPVIELSPMVDAPAGLFALNGPASAPAPVSATGTRLSDEASPQDIALVLHTSGTTSRPKLVPITHANITASALNVAKTLELTRRDGTLSVMPLFHIHGLVATLLASLVSGASIFCPPLFSPGKFFAWYEEARPTWYSAVPTIHMSILGESKKASNSALIEAYPLRFIRSSSASLPASVMEELEAVFQAPVIEAYGMTEAAHQMTSNQLPPGSRRPGSVGVAAGPEVAIMDESGNLLSTGNSGEIVIRGASVISGYEDNPEANRDAFTSGWFRTGDQGSIDESGFLTITGRIKEIISRGGEKISPREIDEALLGISGIKEAVAFAVPHQTLGEAVAAAVVPVDGAQLDEVAIRGELSATLAAFKVPERIILVESIPKGATGKVQRIKLAGRLQDQLNNAYAAPRSPIEKAVQDMWHELVPSPHLIGIHDNFFLAGGESLRLTQLLVRLKSAYDIDIPVSRMFLSPTIAGISAFIISKQAEKAGLDIIKLLDEVEASSQST